MTNPAYADQYDCCACCGPLATAIQTAVLAGVFVVPLVALYGLIKLACWAVS